MQRYDVRVHLAGNVQNEVLKRDVTAPEVYCLRAIHGDSSVTIEGRGVMDKRGHAEERARLAGLYGEPVVAQLFGPSHTRLPVTVEGLAEPEPERPARRGKKAAQAEPEPEAEDASDDAGSDQ